MCIQTANQFHFITFCNDFLALVQHYHSPVKLKVISNVQMTHIQRLSLPNWHYMCVCVSLHSSNHEGQYVPLYKMLHTTVRMALCDCLVWQT